MVAVVKSIVSSPARRAQRAFATLIIVRRIPEFVTRRNRQRG